MTVVEQAQKIRADMSAVAAEMTDEQALSYTMLFEPWTHKAYSVGDRCRYGRLYRCVQAHTAQEGWEPDKTPALWTPISLDEYPEWVQPTGVQDAYSAGDKVAYNGRRYISTIDNNTWSPAAYPAGWMEV